MIINIQAFNATGKDNRRIYDVLDDFQSRKPIDVISANRPIVIIDEPQKIGRCRSRWRRSSRFNALMVLRYSATHKVEHTKVHRLDALDAYNQKLVKKIAVRGITVKGLAGRPLPLPRRDRGQEGRRLPDGPCRAGGADQGRAIKRQVKRVEPRAPTCTTSRAASRRTRTSSSPTSSAIDDTIELSNGDVVVAGAARRPDVTEETEAAHPDPRGHPRAPRQGARALRPGHQGPVAVLHRRGRQVPRLRPRGHPRRLRPVFEEEYDALVEEVLGELELDGATAAYQKYLSRDECARRHQGYFSIDKKSKRLVDGDVAQDRRREGPVQRRRRRTT